MNLLLESLKALLFGIVEGVTEWLPISSTGHMILLDEFVQLQMTDAFKSMFEVVIQLGAILAVVVLSAVVVGIMDKDGMSSQLARTDSLTADSSIRKSRRAPWRTIYL